MRNEQRSHWSGRIAFILAAVGSAVGLGNIWKFPHMAGENGGGLFVLIYLGCIALVGLPVFIAELYLGQKSQANAVTAFERLHKPGTPWVWLGFMCVLSTFLVAGFYSVVGGWVLEFELQSLTGSLFDKTQEQIQAGFGELISNPIKQLLWHTLFMALCVGIVVAGVKRGLERCNKILMPILLVLLFILFVRTTMLPGFGQAFVFLFDFSGASSLSLGGVMSAVGHSFFTLSLGMGTILTYGSYLSRKENLVKTGLSVAFLDTFIALIAGLVTFAIVFSYGLSPGDGPGLIFATLPSLFQQMPGGQFLAILFFALVAFAAITSMISIVEVPVAYIEERFCLSRIQASLIVGGTCWLLGILSLYSFTTFSNLSLPLFGTFESGFFDIFDKLTTNVLMPLAGLLTVLFFGWVLGEKAIKAVLGDYPEACQVTFLWVCRLIAPFAVVAVFIYQLF